MASDNYLHKLAEVVRSLRLPPETVTHVWIAHDDWCATWRGRRCNCQPELKVYREEGVANHDVN